MPHATRSWHEHGSCARPRVATHGETTNTEKDRDGQATRMPAAGVLPADAQPGGERAVRRDAQQADAPSIDELQRSRPRLVLEVAAVREDHRDAGGVGGLDDLVVALRAARLDDRRDARVDRELRAVGEREEGVGGQRGAEQRGARARGPSRSRAGRSPRGSSGRRRCRPRRGRWTSTIALERTCLQTFQANSISPHSASVGLRSVTTSISVRSSRPMSRSWTSRPPMTRLRSRSAMLTRRRSPSSRMRMFGLLESSSSASSVNCGAMMTSQNCFSSASANGASTVAVDADHAAEGRQRVARERRVVGLERPSRRRPRRTGCCA